MLKTFTLFFCRHRQISNIDFVGDEGPKVWSMNAMWSFKYEIFGNVNRLPIKLSSSFTYKLLSLSFFFADVIVSHFREEFSNSESRKNPPEKVKSKRRKDRKTVSWDKNFRACHDERIFGRTNPEYFSFWPFDSALECRLHYSSPFKSCDYMRGCFGIREEKKNSLVE